MFIDCSIFGNRLENSQTCKMKAIFLGGRITASKLGVVHTYKICVRKINGGEPQGELSLNSTTQPFLSTFVP